LENHLPAAVALHPERAAQGNLPRLSGILPADLAISHKRHTRSQRLFDHIHDLDRRRRLMYQAIEHLRSIDPTAREADHEEVVSQQRLDLSSVAPDLREHEPRLQIARFCVHGCWLAGHAYSAAASSPLTVTAM
jgi:hypothetical protein